MAITVRPCRSVSITVGGTALAGIIDATVTLNMETIEVTELSGVDRKYIAGIKSGTVSATVFYDSADAVQAAIETAYGNGTEVVLVFTWHTSNSYTCNALITSVTPSVAVNDVIRCSFQMQITGPVTIS